LPFHQREVDHGDFSNEWNSSVGIYVHTFRNGDANNSGSGGADPFIETQHDHVSFRVNTCLWVDITGDANNSGGGGSDAGKFIQAQRHYVRVDGSGSCSTTKLPTNRWHQ
jgi:hypothetical protein